MGHTRNSQKMRSDCSVVECYLYVLVHAATRERARRSVSVERNETRLQAQATAVALAVCPRSYARPHRLLPGCRGGSSSLSERVTCELVHALHPALGLQKVLSEPAHETRELDRCVEHECREECDYGLGHAHVK